MTTAATEIKLIKIGQRALGLDDGTYRAMLANLAGGKTSSTALTSGERQRVLAHLKASGFVLVPKAGSTTADEAAWQHGPQLRKLRAMWWLLAADGHVAKPATVEACTAAVEVWAKRQLIKPPLAAMRFATTPQMDKLIESLKAWCARAGLGQR